MEAVECLLQLLAEGVLSSLWGADQVVLLDLDQASYEPCAVLNALGHGEQEMTFAFSSYAYLYLLVYTWLYFALIAIKCAYTLLVFCCFCFP